MPGQKTREPMQGEFFATEAIRNPAEALVREAIQNSLDAGERDERGLPLNAVKIRIHVASGEEAADPNGFSEFMTGLWPHLNADRNGLKEPPKSRECCPYLVFEDFGTTGLKGDVSQWIDDPAAKNAFYYFFRAEGRTGKGDDDRGRWGIGKYVFPRSSSANTFFGLTVREGEEMPLLLGQAVLRTHCCDEVHYTPDGGFGDLGGNGLVLPVSDVAMIGRFSKLFCVSREKEPGLSIVVPWVNNNEFNHDLLVAAVVRGYFYPILEGKLEIRVSEGANVTLIDAETLAEVAGNLPEALSEELLPTFELAEWASVRKPADFFVLNMAPNRPAWSKDLIPEEFYDDLQTKLDNGQRIALRVPLSVRRKGAEARDSYFDIFMVRDGTGDGRSIFVREGIIVSDVRARRVRGLRSLVVVEDGPLAGLLGDSENPAHTEWQSKSANFEGKYINGPSYLAFVTHCVSSIENILGARQEQEDVAMLKDFFFLPSPPAPETPKARKKRKKKSDGPISPSPDPKPEPRKKRYRLERIAGGFRVCNGDPDCEVPHLIEIKAAYDVRRGNPLKKYDKADFDLASPVFVEATVTDGIMVESRDGNKLVLKVLSRDFRFQVSGFDTNRDLLVNVRVKEVAGAA